MSQRSHAVRIRLTPRQAKLLEQRAARYGLTVVEWLENVIRHESRQEARWPRKVA